MGVALGVILMLAWQTAFHMISERGLGVEVGVEMGEKVLNECRRMANAIKDGVVAIIWLFVGV